MDNNNEERLKLESILYDAQFTYMEKLVEGRDLRIIGVNKNYAKYGHDYRADYDTDLIDSYIKKCNGDKWKDNKDESVKSIISVIMYAYGSSFKKTGYEKIDKEKEREKNEILEKIQNSNLSKEFLQEISRTLNLLKSGIDNKKFNIDGDYLLFDSHRNSPLRVNIVSDKLNQSIEFVKKQQQNGTKRMTEEEQNSPIWKNIPSTYKKLVTSYADVHDTIGEKGEAIKELGRKTKEHLNNKTLNDVLEWKNKEGADKERERLKKIIEGLGTKKHKEKEIERQQQQNSKRGRGSAER
jgi:hypothetical protein